MMKLSLFKRIIGGLLIFILVLGIAGRKTFLKGWYARELQHRGYDVTDTKMFFGSAFSDEMDKVELFVKAGMDVNVKNERGVPALNYALTLSGYSRTVEKLIELGADVNAVDNAGKTPLMECIASIKKRDIYGVRKLIEHGANVNAVDNEGRTPLMWAVDDDDIMRLLIEKGANANFISEDGISVLLAYLTRGALHSKMIKYYAAKGDGDNDKHVKEELAGGGKNLDMVKLLVDKGANVNQVSKEGITVLTAAINIGDVNIPNYLIDKGADVNHLGAHSVFNNELWLDTPLRIAIDNGFNEITKLLIEKGANVNDTGAGGRTALTVAQEKSDVETVKILISNGAIPFDKFVPSSIGSLYVSTIRIAVSNKKLSDLLNNIAKIAYRDGYEIISDSKLKGKISMKMEAPWNKVLESIAINSDLVLVCKNNTIHVLSVAK
jgi:ankyrin repeat protein